MSIRVWDPVVRICHWGMSVLLPLCWFSAEQGEMEWHQTFAYLLAALLLTRLCWALVGSETARFTHFVRSPVQVFRYLRHWRTPRQAHLGHNPAGGYMVLLLWGLLLLQWGSGLFSSDDILTEGPLFASVSGAVSSALTWWHHLGFNLLLGAISLHLLAILLYRWRGVALVPAMLHGKRELATAQPHQASLWLAFGLLLGWLLGFGYWLIWPLW
ncbi:cytochrome b/b6 domain-containing protein [uncultured Ferrimonas sp.]|uniref:cytochrome b/b6 domain-containing protein n=1 Tax=uncultured Ferrimonas sp. TaxID=432640 RepID=UPI002613496D|nr:cytochrome b/b6 domain-containing protein [uncultured Ferrimonas sp.]